MGESGHSCGQRPAHIDDDDLEAFAEESARHAEITGTRQSVLVGMWSG